MDEIDIFKNEFINIADLVVSFDKHCKAILKQRNEIKSYLNNKSLDLQETIIEELIEVNKLGQISDFYLANDRKENGQKISFERYLKIILKTVKSKNKSTQLFDNNHIIQVLKDKIQTLNTKSAKINFLLEKKSLLEGDYPKAFGKILTENEIYLFLKKILKYWEANSPINVVLTPSVMIQ